MAGLSLALLATAPALAEAYFAPWGQKDPGIRPTCGTPVAGFYEVREKERMRQPPVAGSDKPGISPPALDYLMALRVSYRLDCEASQVPTQHSLRLNDPIFQVTRDLAAYPGLRLSRPALFGLGIEANSPTVLLEEVWASPLVPPNRKRDLQKAAAKELPHRLNQLGLTVDANSVQAMVTALGPDPSGVKVAELSQQAHRHNQQHPPTPSPGLGLGYLRIDDSFLGANLGPSDLILWYRDLAALSAEDRRVILDSMLPFTDRGEVVGMYAQSLEGSLGFTTTLTTIEQTPAKALFSHVVVVATSVLRRQIQRETFADFSRAAAKAGGISP